MAHSWRNHFDSIQSLFGSSPVRYVPVVRGKAVNRFGARDSAIQERSGSSSDVCWPLVASCMMRGLHAVVPGCDHGNPTCRRQTNQSSALCRSGCQQMTETSLTITVADPGSRRQIATGGSRYVSPYGTLRALFGVAAIVALQSKGAQGVIMVRKEVSRPRLRHSGVLSSTFWSFRRITLHRPQGLCPSGSPCMFWRGSHVSFSSPLAPLRSIRSQQSRF